MYRAVASKLSKNLRSIVPIWKYANVPMISEDDKTANLQALNGLTLIFYPHFLSKNFPHLSIPFIAHIYITLIAIHLYGS